MGRIPKTQHREFFESIKDSPDYILEIENNPAYNYLFEDDIPFSDESNEEHNYAKKDNNTPTTGSKRVLSSSKEEPPNKKTPQSATANTNLSTEQNEIADVEMTSLPGTGGGSGGRGPGNATPNMPVYQTPKPLSIFGTKSSIYKKVHSFLTFGIAPNVITKETDDPVETQKWISTCLAQIPWELPCLYLTPSEFNLLPPGAHVKQVHVKVIHRGTRFAFNTANTMTQLATLNQVQNVITAYGLNKTGWGRNSTYTGFGDTEDTRMVPNGVDTPSSLYARGFYGYENNNSFYDTVLPTHQLAIPYLLQNYFTLCTAKTSFGGVPPIIEHYESKDGKTTINTVVAEVSYSPHIGLLKPPLKYIRSGLPAINGSSPSLDIPVNGSISNSFTTNITGTESSSGVTQTNGTSATNPTNGLTFNFTIETEIEKSQYMKRGPWGQMEKCHVQPSLHVGIQAIPSLTSTNIFFPITSWTDTQAYFDVECTMEVVEHLPTKFPYATDANVPAGEVYYQTTEILPTNNSCTFAGLYTSNPIRAAK